MLWRQLEGWQPSFSISLVIVQWPVYVTKLDGISFRQWLGSCLVKGPANTLINSVGDYYNTLGWRQFYCLFNSLFGLTTKKTSRQRFPVLLWGELTYYRGFPLQRASNAQSASMAWRYHEKWQHIKTLLFLYFIHWWLVYCFQWRLWVVDLTDLVVNGGTVGCHNGNVQCHREDVGGGLVTILGLRC